MMCGVNCGVYLGNLEQCMMMLNGPVYMNSFDLLIMILFLP